MSAASPRPGRGQRIGFWLAVALALAALGGCAAVYAESETARQDWRRERAELRNRIVFQQHLNKELRARVKAREAELARITVNEKDVARLGAEIAAARREMGEIAAARERARAAARVELAEAEAERQKALDSARAALARAGSLKDEIAAGERRLAELGTVLASRWQTQARLAAKLAAGATSLKAIETRAAAERADLDDMIEAQASVARERKSVEIRIAAAKESLNSVNAVLLIREQHALGLEELILKARSEIDQALRNLERARRQMSAPPPAKLREPGSRS